MIAQTVQTQRQAAEELITRYRTNPVSLLVPNGAQEKWIRMIGTHEDGRNSRDKVLSAANKIGKSTATIAAMASIFWGPQSDWFDYPIFREWPFPKICWFISTESALKEILIPLMKEWFPKGRFKPLKRRKDYEYEWTTDTGWKMFLKTYDQDPLAFESALLGLCVFSEPPPERIWNAIPARMSEGGLRLLEMTPLVESAWVFDKLVGENKVDIMYADIEENCEIHGVRGRLTHFNVQNLIDSYDSEEREARVHGKSINLRGRVYKMFNPNIHVTPSRELAGGEQIWFIIDPHDAKPPFINWWALNQTGDLRCLLEYPVYAPGKGYEKLNSTRLTVDDFAEIILKVENEYGFKDRIVKRIIDPYFGGKRYGNTDITVQETYRNAGIRCTYPPAGKEGHHNYGHAEVRKYLDFEEGSPGRTPKMKWEHHCQNSIRAMLNYSVVYPKKRRDDRDIVSEKFQLTEKWKHGADVARYLVISKPQFSFPYDREPKGWRERMAQQNWKSKQIRSDFNPLAN